MAKVGPAVDRGRLVGQQRGLALGDQRVGDRLPERVGLVGVDDVPGAADRPVGVALRLATRGASRVRGRRKALP